jgi:L-fucose mutarotase
VDANFPGASVARWLVRLPGLQVTDALQAILTLLPIDDFVEAPAAVMQPDTQNAQSAIFSEFQAICDAAEGRAVSIARLERFAFYDRARSAYAVVQTGERRLYGNIILSKGIVRPDAGR